MGGCAESAVRIPVQDEHFCSFLTWFEGEEEGRDTMRPAPPLQLIFKAFFRVLMSTSWLMGF